MFLNRPYIQQDESLGSYLCRVSEANYYESIITLGKIFKFNHFNVTSSSFDKEILKDLSVFWKLRLRNWKGIRLIFAKLLIKSENYIKSYVRFVLYV